MECLRILYKVVSFPSSSSSSKKNWGELQRDRKTGLPDFRSLTLLTKSASPLFTTLFRPVRVFRNNYSLYSVVLPTGLCVCFIMTNATLVIYVCHSVTKCKFFVQQWTSLNKFEWVWTGLNKIERVWTSLNKLNSFLDFVIVFLI